MKNIAIYIYILLISCSDFSDNFIIGTWIQNEALYKKEVMKLNKPMGNLSEAFGEIKLIFNRDYTYQTYFDNQIHNGLWKISNDLFYMKRDDMDWIGYKYKISNNELLIYADPWLMALVRK